MRFCGCNQPSWCTVVRWFVMCIIPAFLTDTALTFKYEAIFVFISWHFLFERFHVKIWHHYLFKAMITCKSSRFLMFKAMAAHIAYVYVCSFVCSYSDLLSLSLVASLFLYHLFDFGLESVGNVHHSFKHSSQGFQFSCFFSMQWCQY